MRRGNNYQNRIRQEDSNYRIRDTNSSFRDSDITELANLCKQVVKFNLITNSEIKNDKGNVPKALLAYDASHCLILNNGANRHMTWNLNLLHEY